MTTDCSWLSRFSRPVFLWWMAAFAAELAVGWELKHGGLNSRTRLIVALFPAAMWICVVVAFVWAVLRADEFQQRIQLQALAIACVPTAILALIFSGLERAGIYHATWSDIGGPFMFLLLLAYFFSAWRYR